MFLSLALLLGGCGDDDADDVAVGTGSLTKQPAELAPIVWRNRQLTPILPDHRFDMPLDLDFIPGEPRSYLVVEQAGRILHVDAEGEVTTAADLTNLVLAAEFEEGLYSLLFAPDFEDSGELYLYYAADEPMRGVLSRFSYAGGLIDPDSEQVLLEVPHEDSIVHWGGGLGFGPDGYLYLGLGDGGPQHDANPTGQDPTVLQGVVIRIDVAGAAYQIPTDNPFVGNVDGYREEVYAYGFRNPYRLSFDSETGDLWIADVGYLTSEEVNLVEAGGNYGWRIYEGFDCLAGPCDTPGLIDPVATYGQNPGCAVIGGHVYHGRLFPQLAGAFIVSDYCSGIIRAARPGEDLLRVFGQPGPVTYSLALDEAGEILVLAQDGGIYRLEPAD